MPADRREVGATARAAYGSGSVEGWFSNDRNLLSDMEFTSVQGR